jgi:hypothetical protein
MSRATGAAMYFGMLVFDLATMAGTVYLTDQRGWSAWWWVLAVLLMAGSSPRTIIESSKGNV